MDLSGRLPIVTAFNCLAGQFGCQGVDSIAQTLLMKPHGGAAAVWSNSGLSVNHRVGELGRSFYKAIFRRGRVGHRRGDIAGAGALRQRWGKTCIFLDIYDLLGDPVTIMKCALR